MWKRVFLIITVIVVLLTQSFSVFASPVYKSGVRYAVPDFMEQVATPVVSPAGGEFAGSVTVTITCDTWGADIYYTTDEEEYPSILTTKYKGKFDITETTTLKVVAVKNGMAQSDIVTYKFIKKKLIDLPGVILCVFKFESNGGTEIEPIKFVLGEDTRAPKEPELKDYKFAGWYTDPDFSSEYKFGEAADNSYTLYAKWEPIVYCSVEYNSNGGSEVESQKYVYGEKALAPAPPVREDYEFVGWYTDEGLENKYWFSNKLTSDLVLYAKWKAIDYTKHQIVFTIDEKQAIVFGKNVTNDVAPVIINSRTMLPARFVAENLGATVLWDEVHQKVTVTKDKIEIIITIGTQTALVNGEETVLDSPAFIENDRTYTPVRFIAEKLGAKVFWDEETRQVTVRKAE